MFTITIPLNNKTVQETEKPDGLIISVNWDALLPTINNFVRLRPDEVIDGLFVSDTEVRVKVSRKKGRKAARK